LDDESKAHFDCLLAILDATGLSYEINPRLVRGLDYYGKTVFEWVTDKLGAQGTICAGGRFDALVEQLGSKPVPAIGFAMGLERLSSLLDEAIIPQQDYSPHAYLVLVGEAAQTLGMPLAEELRDLIPNLRLQVHCGGGSFKSQLKRADKSGAPLALIVAEEEAEKGMVSVKYLREKTEQLSCPKADLIKLLTEYIKY
ncbi:MAG: ATP phosphoribosyltransferase regulatory subunit, partial [Gammaproteobacteria bacterium]|nr:ATP phosphoribosyltransferase regulatory subunit [Gammaproteobacteria bacterium]